MFLLRKLHWPSAMFSATLKFHTHVLLDIIRYILLLVFIFLFFFWVLRLIHQQKAYLGISYFWVHFRICENGLNVYKSGHKIFGFLHGFNYWLPTRGGIYMWKQLCLLTITEFTSTLIRIGCGIALINDVLLAVLIEKRFDYLVILRYFPGYMWVNLYYIFFNNTWPSLCSSSIRLNSFSPGVSNSLRIFWVGHTELQLCGLQ